MKKTSDIPAKGIRWNLSDLYKSINDPQIEKDKNSIKKLTQTFIKKYKGKINSKKITANLLLQAITDVDILDEKLAIYTNFASYLFSQDSTADDTKAFYEAAMEFDNQITAQLTWFLLEWQKLDNKTASKLLKDKKLANYRHFLQHTRAFKPFRLTEPEEVIITKKSLTGSRAFVRFYDEVETRQTYDIALDGKKQKMNFSQIASILKSHPKRDARKRAAEAISTSLKDNQHFYTFVLNNLLLDKKVSDEIRGYKYPEHATFLSYEVDPEVVEALVGSVKNGYSIAHKFYTAKRRLMNIDKLYEWDRYSLPFPDKKLEFSWDQTKKLILQTFEEFSPEFSKIAKMFFDKGWIDAEVTKNKRSGAYCSYNVPSKHPYILLNFMGQIDDVSTAAHELGHGIHAYLARKNTFAQFYPSTAVAEIASVFCENLLFEKLLSEQNDVQIKLNLMANKIQGSFATIFRQTAFYLFEKEIHKARREQGTLKTLDINKYFQDALQPMFGKSLTLTPDHAYWWMPVGHFYHYNFYVFTYSFGEALTNALYALFLKNKNKFIKNYVTALEAGGSLSPKEVVSLMGINITDPSFWNKGLDLIDAQVNRFIDLAKDNK